MLTPDDIAHRRFLISLRGYDRDEVTTFLEEVGEQVRGLRRRLAELEAQVERDGEAVAAAGGDVRAALQVLGEEITRVLVAAEDSARETQSNAAVAAQEHRDEAAREARETVEQANRQAARVIAEAERRRDAVADEIAALERDRDRFLDELRASMASIGGVVGDLSGTAAGQDGATVAAVDTPISGDDATAAAEAEPVDVVIAPGDGSATPEQTPDDEPVVFESDVAPAAESTTGETPLADPSTAASEDVLDDVTRDIPAPPQVVEDTPAAPGDVEVATDAAERAEAVESAEAADAVAAADVVEVVDGDEVATVGSRRDASLHDLREAMGRQCKRGMQEIQNEVLASIRDQGRGASLDDLLPSEAELDDLGARAVEHLRGAYGRARTDAATELGADTPADDGDMARVQAAVAGFRAVLAHEITSALRATLRAGIEAEEPAPQLSERVGEAFRDLRGPVIETAVEEHLQRTYAHGLLDAWAQLGVEQIRWLAVDEPRCPERRCRTNAAEGAMAIGTAFPSGDAVPPAHQGCLCVVVPSDVEVG